MPMTEEREDYMRRQEMDHDLIRMRDPSYRVGRFTGMVNEDRVPTRVVGHVPPRYPGEAKSRREIRQRTDDPMVFSGHPLTDRMKRLGITGMVQTLGGGWQIDTPNGRDYAPQEVALWLAERTNAQG